MGRREVDVAVAQFGQHVAQHLEELFLRHAVVDLRSVACVDLLPVEPIDVLLVVEEAVVLVDDAPEGLEVALWRVVEFLFVDAGRRGEAHHQADQPDETMEWSYGGMFHFFDLRGLVWVRLRT